MELKYWRKQEQHKSIYQIIIDDNEVVEMKLSKEERRIIWQSESKIPLTFGDKHRTDFSLSYRLACLSLITRKIEQCKGYEKQLTFWGKIKLIWRILRL